MKEILPEHTNVTIEWSEVKHKFLSILESDSPPNWASQPKLDEISTRWWNSPTDTTDHRSTWEGGSAAMTAGYLRHGFFTEDFTHAVEENHALIRPLMQYNDEEGEVEITKLIAGDDDIFFGVTPMKSKTGIRVRIEMAFGANGDPRVLREYGAWNAALINSLMESGYDLEIDLWVPITKLFPYANDPAKRERTNVFVRIKDFGEILDFTEFSAVFGPTGFRQLIFLALGLAGDHIGEQASSTLGQCITGPWGVTFDEQTRELLVNIDQTGFADWAAERLTAQAADAGLLG